MSPEHGESGGCSVRYVELAADKEGNTVTTTRRHQRLARSASKDLYGAVFSYVLFFVLYLVGNSGPLVLIEAFFAMLGSVLLLAAILYRVLSDYASDDTLPEVGMTRDLPNESNPTVGSLTIEQSDHVVAGIHVVGITYDAALYLLREDLAHVLGVTEEAITASVNPVMISRFNYSARADVRRQKRASFIRGVAIPPLAERFPSPAATALTKII